MRLLKPLSGTLAFVDKHARVASVAIAVLSFLAGTATNWLPVVQIDTGPIIDDSSIFGTEFRFWNSGKVPVYDVQMVCNVDARPTITVENQMTQPVAKLSPRHSAERGCDIGAPGMKVKAKYTIRVYYTWPLIKRRTWVEQTFSSFVNKDNKVSVYPDTQ